MPYFFNKHTMKKVTYLFFFFISSFALKAQSVNDVFSANELVWYGFDFSNVKLIGSEAFNNPSDIKARYFDSWNNLIFTEQEKYNLQEFTRKSNIVYELKVVEQRNQLPLWNELVINADYSMDISAVETILNAYDTEKKQGVGLVYIVESLDKARNRANVFVTFFDIATKKVLLVEKMQGEPVGIGFRNYWAGGFYDIFKKMDKAYPKWKKKYTGSKK